MPYITKAVRKHMKPSFDWHAMTPGELNFQITTLIVEYLSNQAESYHAYNEVIGVLECAKLELYRRMVAPYETKKHAENGDVYLVARSNA